MLGDPPVLVLDEVTASLDACGRNEFMTMLTQLSGAGRTLLFASHRMDEIAQLARRVVVMERGRVTQTHDVGEFQTCLAAESALTSNVRFSGLDHTLQPARNPGSCPTQGAVVRTWRATA